MASAEEEANIIEEDVAEQEAGEETETTEKTVDEEVESAEEDSASEAADDAAEDEVSGGEASDTEGASAKKKLFGRKDKKDKKDEKIEELNDLLKSRLAEFENFRNRSEREKAQRFEMGERNVLEKILPVVDNFERGFAGIDENSEDPFVKGMAQVYKQLQNVLTDLGVEPIEAVGCDFDPNLHNAVMQDSVLRHSMVSVVQ